jgi:aminopeptidase N
MVITRRRFVLKNLAIVLVCIIVLISNTSCQAAIGGSGVGDPYHPELGNGGYDVDHYDIALRIDPLSNFINADVMIEATATERLRSFNLDFGTLSVVSLKVNGTPASFSQDDNEITVTPSKPLSAGRPFRVNIEYEGNPEPIDSLVLHSPVGWFHSQDGTINVVNWPDGAGSWLPGNHHPSDKATFHFEISVPDPWVVVAPGSEQELKEVNGEKHYVFEMDVPMASVSAVLYVDDYNESVIPGPATYAGWLWENRGESSEEMDRVAKNYQSLYEGLTRPSVQIGVPPDEIITDAIYGGAGLLLHSLRREVGDEAFFNILREYLSRYQYLNATTSDFIDIAEEISGRDLKPFFDSWLYEVELPPVLGSE